jgi:hypothetical protein
LQFPIREHHLYEKRKTTERKRSKQRRHRQKGRINTTREISSKILPITSDDILVPKA